MSNLDFRTNLIVDNIYGIYSIRNSENMSLNDVFQINNKKYISITGIHYIEKNSERGECVLCKINNKPRRRIIYSCSECYKYLCVECFQDYHEKYKYHIFVFELYISS